MKLTDERIIDYLKKKNGENFDVESFLNTSAKDLRDAKKFKNIDKIVEKINLAIKENKRILIYGDYDSDGVCASTILYLFFKSKGASVDVFIPNRFENGYGISVDAIEEIVSRFSPELIITVDLGITAIEEVEILKQENIDIIITDHHLPLSEVPNCLILDPKYDNEEYGFDSLCGAGVAMKLVEALSSREEANKYLDIAAIATVGDIVPLIDENRAIAKLGIEKINSGDCHKSLSFIKSKLEIGKLSSTDISFKVVPRFNACGRMDDAIKVFNFLILEDERELEKQYREIENDNNLRLKSIEKGNEIASKFMSEFDFEQPAIFITGNFHEGIIGILASRVCHEYNKPCIVFTKTENGTLKGSGRSIEGINLHKIIAGFADMLENFGGHKMAIGLEIEPSVFEVFKSKVNLEIRRTTQKDVFLLSDKDYDIEISEADISEKFYNQLELLEPFGEGNQKPVVALKANELSTEPISEKAYKHYKFYTKNNHSFVGFNFYNFVPAMKSESEKIIKLDLSINHFNGKNYVQASAKDVAVTHAKFGKKTAEEAFLSALFNLYYSIFDFNNKDKYHILEDLKATILKLVAEDDFGTLILAQNEEDLKIINDLNLSALCSPLPKKNGQNAVVCTGRGIYSLAAANGYRNIIFMSKFFENEHLYFSQKYNVYEAANCQEKPTILDKDRLTFAKVYSLIKANSNLHANDELDFANKLAIREPSLSAAEILFAMIVFFELNFIEFDQAACEMKVLSAKKVELDKSKFYSEV